MYMVVRVISGDGQKTKIETYSGVRRFAHP